MSQAGKGVVCGGFVGWMTKGLSWTGDWLEKGSPKGLGLNLGSQVTSNSQGGVTEFAS